MVYVCMFVCCSMVYVCMLQYGVCWYIAIYLYVAVFPTAMIVPDETVVILNGTVLELSCVTSGTPPPQVTWSRDGMLLQADGTEVIITEDNLVITNSSVLNSGQYHCTATSSAGLVSSAVQVLVLSEEQRLTEAVVRADVLLECSSGVPAGVAVQWSFNDSTLAPVSSKYVVLRNGSLLVQDVWVEDMGEYTCQLGDIQLRNTLTLTGIHVHFYCIYIYTEVITMSVCLQLSQRSSLSTRGLVSSPV